MLCRGCTAAAGATSPGSVHAGMVPQYLNHPESQHDICGLPHKMETFLTIRNFKTLYWDVCICDKLVRVFMQGNLVFNAQQELIYRRDLERPVVETAIHFAAEHGALNLFCSVPGRPHASALAQPFPQMST